MSGGGGSMARRRFLALAGGAGLGAVSGLAAWRALLDEGVPDPGPDVPTSQQEDEHDGRVLVLLQLLGGNDGLNTLVPTDDGRYYDARPTLAIGEAEVVSLTGTDQFGLAPALAPVVPLWESGRLAFIEAVGFEQLSRSHFQALDTWWSAGSDQSHGTGWLGRWLDAGNAEERANPLRAIALGEGSAVLFGQRSIATAVVDPAGFRLELPPRVDRDAVIEALTATAAPLVAEDSWMSTAQLAIPDAVGAADMLGRAAGPDGRRDATQPITSLLQTAAGILDLDVGTRVISIGVNGFDTHAQQAEAHRRLLGDLANGLAEFSAAIERQGRAGEVLLVATSEFGRRVKENGSGTDHGTGGLAIVAGAGVAGGQVVGEADLGDLVRGDLRSTIDARSVYSVALDWLGGPVDEVLGGTFDRLGLLR